MRVEVQSFELKFGPTALRIAKQLDQQKLGGSNKQRASWQKSADAITWLLTKGILSTPHAYDSRLRLLRDISGTVNPLG